VKANLHLQLNYLLVLQQMLGLELVLTANQVGLLLGMANLFNGNPKLWL